MGTSLVRIVIVAGYAPSLINFRGWLLRDLIATGCEVTAIAPDIGPDVAEQLRHWGIKTVSLSLARASLNPLRDLAYYRVLRRNFAALHPEVILAYTHKPVVYSALAAHAIPTARVYGLITGLGYAFADEHSRAIKQRLARASLCWLYRRARPRWSGMIFQNRDDQALFLQLGLISPVTPQQVVRGSGVDLNNFPYCPASVHPARVLLIARLLRDKGISEYVQAARAIKLRRPDAEFHLVGPVDPNPAAISADEVNSWVKEGVIYYHGTLGDVRSAMKECTIYVLPSYREGTPRTVLEAMATGRAVITTDTAGCRETIFEAGPSNVHGVREGLNGLLVPVRDSEALAAALEMLLKCRETVTRMGREGRRLAELHYGVNEVNRSMMSFMGLPPLSVRATH
jgi:glycosyltransferase involved in cell wall biosynthesis